MTSAALSTLLLVAAGSVLADKGWTVLFDGRSTDAWRGYRRDSFPADCWRIEDGALKTIPQPGERCDIITKEKYRDFELELEWKLGPRGNSGVFYRAAELPPPDPVWHSAPEMQILDDDAYRDGHPENLTGGLYDLIAAKGKKVRPLGEWNQVRLRVQGDHVEHWLNGVKVVEYDLGSPSLRALIAKSKFKDMPRFAREKEGHIGLQHHGEEAWFRNVRIRRLAARAPRH